MKEEKASKSILVFGEYIIDEYIIGGANLVSNEAPIPIINRIATEYFPGGSGNLISNIISLGGKCDFVGLIGDSETKEMMISGIESIGISKENLIELPGRINSLRTRIICNGKQVTRIDTDDSNIPNYESIYEVIYEKIKLIPNYDIVIIQDYGKNSFDGKIIKKIINEAKKLNIRVILDCVSGNPKTYKKSDLSNLDTLKISLSGFRNFIGLEYDSPVTMDSIKVDTKMLRNKYGIKNILITLGVDGIFYSSSEEELHEIGHPLKVYDSTGAGDTVTASASLFFANNLPNNKVLALANLAGLLACRYTGNVSLKSTELMEAYESIGIDKELQ